MTKVCMILAALALSVSAWAADAVPELKVVRVDASMPRLEVLSEDLVTLAGVTLAVKKFKNPAGQVCQEYVSSSYRAGAGPLEVEIESYCNRPVTRKGVIQPAGLASMEWVAIESGLGIHLLTINSLPD